MFILNRTLCSRRVVSSGRSFVVFYCVSSIRTDSNWLPRKHEPSTQRRCAVGPASERLACCLSCIIRRRAPGYWYTRRPPGGLPSIMHYGCNWCPAIPFFTKLAHWAYDVAATLNQRHCLGHLAHDVVATLNQRHCLDNWALGVVNPVRHWQMSYTVGPTSIPRLVP